MNSKDSVKYAICLREVGRGLDGGGHMHMLRFAEEMAKISDVVLVSYKKKEEGVLFLADDLPQLINENRVLVLSWGTDVARLVNEYHGKIPLVYYMKGRDWGVYLTPEIPIITNCKYLLGYAEKNWPGNPKFLLPELLEDDCRNKQIERDIDILIVTRKQTPYILNKLIPKLKKLGQYNIHIQEEYIGREELFDLFNRSKVYLYTFNPMPTYYHFSGYRNMEGSATQVMEALACGCVIVCNLRGGMIDYLDMGINAFGVEKHSIGWDLLQIDKALRFYGSKEHETHQKKLVEDYGRISYTYKLGQLNLFIQEYIPYAIKYKSQIENFNFPTPKTISQNIHTRLYQLKKKYFR